MPQIIFQTQTKKFAAEFNQCLTAQMIQKSLPFAGMVNLWGDEIYIDIGVQASDLHATLDVNVCDIGYRHEEKRLCIFFGKTPSSVTDKPVPAFPVVVIGKILCPPEELKIIKAGESIRIAVQEDRPLTPDPSSSSRKLTQAEIDALVKKLLAEKAAKASK
ncbi:MAG: cyclophilin-like family protein [Candidatus Omnitrophota bacterium]